MSGWGLEKTIAAVGCPLVLIIIAVGCGRERETAAPAVTTIAGEPLLPSVSVVNGVTIMEHDPGALERAPRLALDSVPLAVLGGADGNPAYDLTHAWEVLLLPRNRVATLASVGARLFVFDLDAGTERTIGRPGNGPGELVSPSGLARAQGDTFFVADAGNGRLIWITADAGIVRERPVVDRRALFGHDGAAGTLPDGRVVIHSAGSVQEGIADRVTRPAATVAVLDTAGRIEGNIASTPDLELVVVGSRYGGRREPMTVPLRFGRRAHVVVWNDRVATSSGDGYSIDLRSADGKVVSRLSLRALPRRAVTNAMRESQIALELSWLKGAAEGMIDVDESRRLAREVPFADSLAPHGQLFATNGHTLWVTDAIVPGDISWGATAFRADGAIIARLRVRGSSYPVAFGDDRVILRGEDADGVISLRIHRFANRLP